jgi:hypothetical protein
VFASAVGTDVELARVVSVLVSFTGVRDSASVCERWADQGVKPSAAHRERCHAELTSEGSTGATQPDSNSNGSRHPTPAGTTAAPQQLAVAVLGTGISAAAAHSPRASPSTHWAGRCSPLGPARRGMPRASSAEAGGRTWACIGPNHPRTTGRRRT